MISCTDAVKQLWEYLDQAVGAEEREAIEEHLSFCRRCCGEVEFAQELRKFLAERGTEEIPAEVRMHLTQVLDQLEEAG